MATLDERLKPGGVAREVGGLFMDSGINNVQARMFGVRWRNAGI